MAMLILQLSVVLILILVNGFFAMAEIALVSARKARLQSLAEGGSANARAALALKADPSRLLSTVQIGITVIAVLSGTFGQATLGDRLEQDLAAWSGFDRPARASDQHGDRRGRHLLCLADPWRTAAKADRAPPSRADRRRTRPDHARLGAGGGADRLAARRFDQFPPPPACRCAANGQRR